MGIQLLPKKGVQPPLFGPCLLWPDVWMDQDKMPLGREIDFDPGDIVLDGHQASPKGALPPIFGQCLLWTNGQMDQDATLYGG